MKHPKTSKISLIRTERIQNDEGGWLQSTSTSVPFWANVRGQRYTTEHTAGADWPKPSIVVTISRSSLFEPRIGDHIEWEGRYWRVAYIDDLTFAMAHDLKLVCAEDIDFRPKGLQTSQPQP